MILPKFESGELMRDVSQLPGDQDAAGANIDWGNGMAEADLNPTESEGLPSCGDKLATLAIMLCDKLNIEGSYVAG